MHQGKNDLFQLQTELVDMKVNMSVGNAIDRVVAQISDLNVKMSDLKNEMHTQISDLRHELRSEIYHVREDMNKGFASLDTRVTAIETKLGMSQETREQVKSKLIDYSFRAVWAIFTFAFAYIIVHLPTVIK